MFTDRESLQYLPQVDFTSTWRPYPHHEIVDITREIADSIGLIPINETYQLSANFHNLFSVFDFKSPHDNYYFQLGMRNSTNKKFALGFCSGVKVVVCSNMCFSGNFIDVQVHNTQLDISRILDMLNKTIGQLTLASGKTIQWLEGLKQIPMKEDDLKIGVFELITKGGVPPGKVKKLIQSVNEEYKLSKGLTPYLLQAGASRMNRGNSIMNQHATSVRVNEIVDLFCKARFPDDYAITLAA